MRELLSEIELPGPPFQRDPSQSAETIRRKSGLPGLEPAKPPIPAQPPVPGELIERRTFLIRAQEVTIDSDLAGLYKALTKNLNKAISRNLDRFPEDFMFRPAPEEVESFRFQIRTSIEGRGARRYGTRRRNAGIGVEQRPRAADGYPERSSNLRD